MEEILYSDTDKYWDTWDVFGKSNVLSTRKVDTINMPANGGLFSRPANTEQHYHSLLLLFTLCYLCFGLHQLLRDILGWEYLLNASICSPAGHGAGQVVYCPFLRSLRVKHSSKVVHCYTKTRR